MLGDDLGELLGHRIPADHSRTVLADDYAARLKARRVMDLGCGAGDSVDLFRTVDPDVSWVGVDIEDSPEVSGRTRADAEFVTFDGRSLPNPGREERFKQLTGRDAPVIDYLNQQGSVHRYFEHVTSLVDSTVTAYRSRGFANLMVSFGCTGGQHRSVFLAEQLAAHLRNRPDVEVVIRHIEMESKFPEKVAS